MLIHNEWNTECLHGCISHAEHSWGDVLGCRDGDSDGPKTSLYSAGMFEIPPSIIHFQLNGGWRIAPFVQWNMLKTLPARQLKGRVCFPRVCIFHLIRR